MPRYKRTRVLTVPEIQKDFGWNRSWSLPIEGYELFEFIQGKEIIRCAFDIRGNVVYDPNNYAKLVQRYMI